MAVLRSMVLLLGLVLSNYQAAKAATLFEDLGERPGIERLIGAAVMIWTTDPRVAPTFSETNIPRLERLIVDQICSLSGGDCKYSGRSMADSHKALHLANVQFNALAEDLQAAMQQLHYPYSVQNRLLALLAPMQRDVVTR